MGPDDLDQWKICWKVDLLFHVKAAPSQRCIVCKEINTHDTNPRRSTFWLEATVCSAGHRQARAEELRQSPGLGVCATCSQSYLFNVVSGLQTCRRDGCRRIVRIREAEVTDRLRHEKDLFNSFLTIVKQRAVFDCEFCGDTIEYADASRKISRISVISTHRDRFGGPTPQCDHDRQVCSPCLTDYMEKLICGGRLKDLICPDAQCKKPITMKIVRGIVAEDVFKIYSKKLAVESLSKSEDFRWCTCGHGQKHEGGEEHPEWICLISTCQKRHCYICQDESAELCKHLKAIDAAKIATKTNEREAARKLLAQSAARAEQIQREKRENVAGTKSAIARTTKKCPKLGCGNRIERKDGCAHFICPPCKTDFCWCCKAIWVNKQPVHVKGCKLGTKTAIPKSRLELRFYAKGWDVDAGYDLTLDSRGLYLIDEHM